MATDKPTGFEPIDDPQDAQSDGDDDAVWIDRPDVGESVRGVLLEVTRNAGEYDSTLLKIRRTDDHDDESGPIALMWSKADIDRRLEAADVSAGDELLIEGSDEFSFEDESGDVIEGVEYEVFVR